MNNTVPAHLEGYISFENGINDEMRRRVFPGQAVWLPVVASIQLQAHLNPKQTDKTKAESSGA